MGAHSFLAEYMYTYFNKRCKNSLTELPNLQLHVYLFPIHMYKDFLLCCDVNRFLKPHNIGPDNTQFTLIIGQDDQSLWIAQVSHI